MTTLTVTVKERQGSFEGTVDVPGLKRTKLTRKDGQTTFETTGALKTTARAVANRLGSTVEYNEPAKKAAKKSIKSKTTSKPTSKPTSKKTTKKTPTSKKTTKPTSKKTKKPTSKKTTKTKK